MSGSALYVDETKFRIRKEYLKLVLETVARFPTIKPTDEWNKWSEKLQVKELLRKLYFGAVFDKEDHLVDIWFTGDVPREEMMPFFQAIAKYVDKGSFLNCQSECEWEFWQWYFNGDCMIEKSGKVVFE